MQDVASVPPPTGPRRAQPCRLLICVALYSLAVVWPLGFPRIDPDFWWHLRAGQWIVDHGQVPWTDPFSSYGQGRTWVAYSWLFEVAAYGLYTRLGLAAAIILRVGLALAVVLGLHGLVRRSRPPFLAEILIVLWGMLILVPLMTERPWQFSILLACATLAVIQDFRIGRDRRAAWLLPVGFGLAANLHIEFVFSLMFLGLALAGPVIDRVRTGPAQESPLACGGKAWRRLLVLAAGCALATLATPYHVHLFRVVLDYGTHTTARRVISELRPPDYGEVLDWLVPLLAGVSLVVAARRRAGASEVLLAGAAAFFAFGSRREAWQMAVVGCALLAAAVPSAGVAGRYVPTRREVVGVVLGLAGVVTVAVSWHEMTRRRLEQDVAKSYPEAAVRFVEDHGLEGPLYNPFDWGGFLIWRMPRWTVSMDGRSNLHGDARLARLARTSLARRGWDDDPDLCAARVILVEADGSLASVLRADSRFRLAYQDDLAAVFVPDSRTSRPVGETTGSWPVQRVATPAPLKFWCDGRGCAGNSTPGPARRDVQKPGQSRPE